MYVRQIVLMGGDARMAAAGDALKTDGYAVSKFWMEGCDYPTGEIPQLKSADALVLPIPSLDKDGRLRAFCRDDAPTWESLREQLQPTCIVFGAGLSAIDWPAKHDFLEDEDFALANAVPTALAESGLFGGLNQFERSGVDDLLRHSKDETDTAAGNCLGSQITVHQADCLTSQR